MSVSRCRFCPRPVTEMDDGVKYGVRHYAHFRCYLEAGKPLTDLHNWQIRLFPYRLLVERGLGAEAKAAEERARGA